MNATSLQMGNVAENDLYLLKQLLVSGFIVLLRFLMSLRSCCRNQGGYERSSFGSYRDSYDSYGMYETSELLNPNL